VTAVVLDAVPAVSVNVVLVAPAETVTLAGTDSSVDELDRATEIPPAGARPVRVTVPTPVRPLITVVGVADRAESVGGVTVRVADALTLGPLAVIRTEVLAVTALLVTVTVTLAIPAATVTLLGTDAITELAVVRVTTKPPAGAALSSRTVAVAVFPPTTVVGESESDATSAANATDDGHVTSEPTSVSKSARCFIRSDPHDSEFPGVGTCPFNDAIGQTHDE
jgi:membrane-associated protease RseP (regulator of RpoE activity)